MAILILKKECSYCNKYSYEYTKEKDGKIKCRKCYVRIMMEETLGKKSK